MSIPAQGAVGADTMTIDHEFKSHPDVFWPAARGEKTFEYRRDDRGGYEIGQTVRLRCYDPARGYHDAAPLDRRITNILRGGEFELPQGYCILSLAPLASPRADSDERMAGEVREAIKRIGDHIHGGNAHGSTADMLRQAAEIAVFDKPPNPEPRHYRERARMLDAASSKVGEVLALLTQSATPAQPAGAVPDSLRALSEAACPGRFKAIRGLHEYAVATEAKGQKGPLNSADADFAAASANFVRALISAETTATPYGWTYIWTSDDCDGGAVEQKFSRTKPDATNPYISDIVPLFASHPAGQSAGQGELIRSLQIELSIAQGANRALKEWIKGYRIKGRFQALCQLPAGQAGVPDSLRALSEAAMVAEKQCANPDDQLSAIEACVRHEQATKARSAFNASCAKWVSGLLASQPVKPGVPCSLRALSEAASAGPFSVSGVRKRYDERSCVIVDAPTCPGLFAFATADGREALAALADAKFFVAAANHVRALIAAQPAGQSAGSGAGCPECFGSGLRDIDGTSDDKCAACDGSGVPAPDSTRTGAAETGAEEADASVPSHILAMAQAMADGRARAWESMRYGACVPQHHSRSYWVMIAQDAYAALAARPAAPEAQGAEKKPATDDLWIKVEDQLPGEQGHDSEEVIVFLNGHCDLHDMECRNGGAWGHRFGWFDTERQCFRVHGRPDASVTHWMPIPAPPASSGQEG